MRKHCCAHTERADKLFKRLRGARLEGTYEDEVGRPHRAELPDHLIDDLAQHRLRSHRDHRPISDHQHTGESLDMPGDVVGPRGQRLSLVWLDACSVGLVLRRRVPGMSGRENFLFGPYRSRGPIWHCVIAHACGSATRQIVCRRERLAIDSQSVVIDCRAGGVNVITHSRKRATPHERR